jgi:hypothetical protein
MTMTNEITNDQDIIDSRDIIERIDELSSYDPSEISKDDLAELLSLKVLAEEAEPGSSDWQHGEQLIRKSYFVEYITDLIHDCYEMPKEMNSGSWPYRHMTIDYEAAANEAEQDYASVDFDGVEYLIRSC